MLTGEQQVARIRRELRKEAAELARDYAPAAMERLAYLARLRPDDWGCYAETNESVQAQCCIYLCDRAYGKPMSYRDMIIQQSEQAPMLEAIKRVIVDPANDTAIYPDRSGVPTFTETK